MTEFERDYFNVMLIDEDMTAEVEKPQIEVTKFLADGFGYGEGIISHHDRRDIVGEQIIKAVESVIESEEILVPISLDKNGKPIDDDGCGDGRGVRRVIIGGEERNKSLDRPKVFGGGATMTTAMSIGLGYSTGHTLREVFSSSIMTLQNKEIDFGAHIDTHAHGDSCGCGAIDKAPIIIQNTVQYAERIKASVLSLGVDATALDEVLGNFASYAEEIADHQDYKGREVADEILENGNVVKELEDDHLEMYVILNTVEGYTINQEIVRRVSENKVQAFGVDVWRMQQLADREYPDDPEQARRAFLSELVYTLATSATLTRGDQPVYLISKKDYALAA